MTDPLEVRFPLSGIDVSGEFGVQRPGTTPVGVNVRSMDPILERNRGGSRHGLIKYPSAQVPAGSALVQFAGQLVVLNASFLLAAFEDYQPNFVPDTSTNNLSTRNPPGRHIPPAGSGVQPNRTLPLSPRRQVQIVPNVTTINDGQTLTLTVTLTKQNAGTNVSGATVTLVTQPAGQAGDGSTAVTNASGVATFDVSEPTFEGMVRYLVVNVYTVP